MKTKRYTYARLLLLCLLFFPFSLSLHAQQVAKSFTAPDGTFLGFYEFKPANYNDNPTKKYPLIIFLHGIGERGDGSFELPYLNWQGLPKLLNEGATMTFTNPNTGEKETFLVLSPQLPKWKGAWENVYVDEMLKYAKTNLRVDTNKIFLTGLSLGGGGVWAYANTSVAHAAKFAAIAPICGVCYYNYGTLCTTIGTANIGVWGFTNADDGVVSPLCTTQACDALAVCNPAKVKKTVYPWGGHDSWTKAYDTGHTIQTGMNLYEWFLANSKTNLNPAPNQAPIANAGTNISITLPVNTVTLNGNASSDPDGSISTYNWTKESGPVQYSFVNAAASSTAVNNLTEGIYSFRLTVTDNKGAVAAATVQVTVNAAPPPPNQNPVANAGSAISITLPVNSTTLNGTASDPDGMISIYYWTKISGPTQFNIVNPAAVTTVLNNLVEGVYSFKLTVTDNNGATASSTVQVTVYPAPPPANQSPVANAGTGMIITLPVNSVTLNGTGSFDPDGSINTFNWTKISGPTQYNIVNSGSSTTTVSNLIEGVYSFRLTVTDDKGSSASATVQVTVNAAAPPQNQPPVARTGAATTITLPVNAVPLNGSSSSDPDGTIAVYNWSKLSGPSQFTIANPLAANTEVSNLLEGVYVFRLTVTDNLSATGSASVTVTVLPGINIAPVAKAGDDRSIIFPAGLITLDGSGSYDPDGQVAAYSWKMISGTGSVTILNSSTAKPGIQGLLIGDYIFQLTVTDNAGASSVDDIKISVTAGQNKKPKADAGKNGSVTLPASSSILDGSLSADEDGMITSYSWRQLSGPSAAVFADKAKKTTEVSQLVEGEYVFILSVADDKGLAATDSVSLVVINNFRVTQYLNLYPNPVRSILNVRYIFDRSGEVRLTIYNKEGIAVKSMKVEKKGMMMDMSIDVTDFKVGFYYLELKFADGKTAIKQFLKR
jgi:hypothetical protein